MKEMTKHGRVGVAALRAGMDRKTARTYLKLGKLPSETKKPRTWRTREDVFAERWTEISAMLVDRRGLRRRLSSRSLQRSIQVNMTMAS